MIRTLIDLRNRRLDSDERGWALVVAVVVMALMLAVGLALLKIVDNQQLQSRGQRVRESSFNLSEGMLYQESQILSRNWPSNATQAFPDDCTNLNATDAAHADFCTAPNTVAAASGSSNPIFSGTDFSGDSSNVAWTIEVRDNGNSTGGVLTNYDKTAADGVQKLADGTACNVLPAKCTWDFNGDKQVFVRVNGTVRGKTRRIVALLKLETRQLKFNGGVATSGWFQSTTSANQTVVDAQGSSATASEIVVRCPSAGSTYNGNTCNNLNTTRQLDPDNAISYGTDPGNALSDADLASLIGSADQQFQGNSATSCPSTLAQWTGVIVIDISPDVTCTMSTQSNDSTNCNGSIPGTTASSHPSQTGYGVVVMMRGKIQVPNNTTYCGAIIDVNDDNNTGVLVDIGDGAEVYGVVAVNGPGGISVHQKNSISYDPKALNLLSGSGTAGLVQSTWRELTPQQ